MTPPLEFMPAVRELGLLQKEWIGSGAPQPGRIRESMLQELRFNVKHYPKERAGVIREIRGKLQLLGRIRRAYGLAGVKFE